MAAKGKKDTHRILAAILCADVVEYGRHMGEDERFSRAHRRAGQWGIVGSLWFLRLPGEFI